MSSCPFVVIPQIGGYLINLRQKEERLELVLKNWNTTVFGDSYRFRFRGPTRNQLAILSLTSQELINRARNIARNLTTIMLLRNNHTVEKTEYFRFLINQFLTQWARERGVDERTMNSSYFSVIKEQVTEAVESIIGQLN